MIIGIDGNEANVSKRVGISEYAFQLLSRFARNQESGIRNQVYLKRQPLHSLPEESDFWKYRVLTPGKLWTQWRLPLDLYTHRPRPDVFFSPTHYAPRFSPVPTVVSVMDLSYLRFPELFNKKDLYQLQNWTAYSVKKAAKVLTISNSSKDDIIKAYNVAPEKVVTVYPGIKEIVTLEPRIYVMDQLKAKYKLSDNFILFVGTLQPRKNISRLIEAFSKIIRHPERSEGSHHGDSSATPQNDMQLVIIGKKGWLYEEILAAPGKFGVEKDVKFLDRVSDQELEIFYKHALCYVLPSLYEGFGLPVLEAMKQGCPVITSNVSSLPEAGGDAALYVDPENVDDIAEKISQLVSNQSLREELIAKGHKQVKKFSWDKAAKETLDVLKSVGRGQ